jgi:hypothetical protein
VLQRDATFGMRLLLSSGTYPGGRRSSWLCWLNTVQNLYSPLTCNVNICATFGIPFVVYQFYYIHYTDNAECPTLLLPILHA